MILSKNKQEELNNEIALRGLHKSDADILKLIDKGANINAKTGPQYMDETILHAAARMGELEKMKFLVENGADVNAQNCRGETPLHSVSSNWTSSNKPEMIKFLMSKNCDTSLRTTSGLTAEEHARANGYPELADLIKKEKNFLLLPRLL